ncbi:DUF4255 domain-containing protein [Myxococcus landrumensis]|uniref:DUF4255 domain-containing protein n=1 Tax=Myxococcus landrumensis TaxID=2813577 RepID=A0ABX7N521_9BACT|nr:DUF4255 domain-containing protein [Myxococcus landrumus]QSQ13857.1 DUF4255 domain-containing protein [Myxococcus landrumus]
MLDIALKFLAQELNAYLLTRTGSEFGKAEMTRLVDDTGKYVLKEDQLGVSLIHLEEERVLKSQMPETRLTGGKHVLLEPPLKLNLHILYAARFTHYDQALRYLAHVLTFFQAHPSFTPEAYPGLDGRIEKLTAELQSLSYEQVNQVWAFVGGKQLPSAIYKVRMVLLQDTAQTSIQQPLTQLDTHLHSR